jgi:hypothetical protein
MPTPRSVRKFSARWLVRALLAISLVFAPAAGTGFLPQPAYAQDAIDFRAALDGYGQWVQHPRWGEVWIPDQMPPDWQPYRMGHWAYTDEWGWYWDSEEDFGWVTYHYGRWAFDRGLGWIWIPGKDWGPAWVDWRQGDNFVGWAPLPPDDVIDEDYETPDTYMFVRAGDLLAPRAYEVFLEPRERFAYYNRSFLVNRSVMLRGGGRIAVNPGVPPAFIARASGRPFRPVFIAPIVLAGTAGVVGAIILRENFRDRERTRVSIREGGRFIQPNDHFAPLKPLQKGERGQLGANAPLAARGVGIETKSKNFGGTPGSQIQNLGVQKQITPKDGLQKTLQPKDDARKTFQPKDDSRKTFQPKDDTRKTFQPKDDSRKTFQPKDDSRKTFQPKDDSRNDQIRSERLQQQNTQQKTLQQQNFQQKSIQQQTVQPRVQQQIVQPKVVQPQNTQPKPVQPQVQPKDKTKQPQ